MTAKGNLGQRDFGKLLLLLHYILTHKPCLLFIPSVRRKYQKQFIITSNIRTFTHKFNHISSEILNSSTEKRAKNQVILSKFRIHTITRQRLAKTKFEAGKPKNEERKLEQTGADLREIRVSIINNSYHILNEQLGKDRWKMKQEVANGRRKN